MLDFAEDKVSTVTKSTSRKRRCQRAILDSVTVLPSALLKAWQADYVVNMQQLRKDRNSQSSRKLTRKNAELLTRTYGGAVLHPLIQTLFCKASRTEAHKTVVDRFPSDCGRPNAAVSESPNIEVPMQDNIVPRDEVELGRRATLEAQDMPSADNSVFPWNASREGSLLRSLSAIHGTAQDTLATQTTPRQFSFVPTPTLRSRQNSALAVNRLSGLEPLERLDSMDAPGMATLAIHSLINTQLLKRS